MIGSGPTGALVAQELVGAGVQVDLVDGGETHESPGRVQELAATVRAGCRPSPDQMRWLRGGSDRGVTELFARAFSLLRGNVNPRDLEKRIVGSAFVFRGADGTARVEGTWLPRSAAVGGLANAWGAACYTLRTDDYQDWPIAASDLRTGFRAASRALGVSGRIDGLAEAYPVPGDLVPVEDREARDPTSVFEKLLPRWEASRDRLAGAGIRAGRSRLAVRPAGLGSRDCVRCGLCTFGCPTGAIWHPAVLLEGVGPLLKHRPGRFIRAIEQTGEGLELVGTATDGRSFRLGSYDAVFLAAGALGSARIAAHTLRAHGARFDVLENDMFLVPFRLDSSISRHRDRVRFALSEAAWAIEPGIIAERPAHVQFYRLTEPLLGPIGQVVGRLPGPAHRLAERVMGRFVMGFLYLHSADSRPIHARADLNRDRLLVDAPGPPAHPDVLHRALNSFEQVAPLTGLRPVGSLARAMPPGFSAHLGGTVPMAPEDNGALTTRADGALRGIDGVYVVDLSVLPAVPAQNATLTGMANALRVVRRFLAQRVAS